MNFFSSMVESVVDEVTGDDNDNGGTEEDESFISSLMDNLGIDKIIEGLKEALFTSVTRAVDSTGREGGFLDNDDIKIPLPNELQSFVSIAQSIGLGDYLDQFQVSLNRAAEQSAVTAGGVFFDSITSMSFDDVQRIWKGSDPLAATNHLKSTCYTTLSEKFFPLVEQAVESNSVTKYFDDIQEQVKNVPFIGEQFDFDLIKYTVEKALDGLFTVMGQKEKEIRNVKDARDTPLLREVFQQQGEQED